MLFPEENTGFFELSRGFDPRKLRASREHTSLTLPPSRECNSSTLPFSREQTNLTLPTVTSMSGILTSTREPSRIPRQFSACTNSHLAPYNDFLLIFDTSSGSNKVSYSLIDPTAKRNHLLPKISTKHLGKIQDVIGYCVVVMDNLLYLIGGLNLKSGYELSSCYKFNPVNNRWKAIANLTQARARHSATVVDGCMYVCGGQIRGGHFTDSVECYEAQTDTWTNCRAMFAPRADHAACCAQGRLLVSGGVGEKSGPHTNFWCYDPVCDFWTQAQDRCELPRPKDGHSMVEYKDRLYVLGGRTLCRAGKKATEEEDERLVSFDSSRVSDPVMLGLWDKSHPDMARVRCNGDAIILGHYIYNIGGRVLTTERNQLKVEKYNIKRKKWMDAFSLPSPGCANATCCVLRVPSSNKEFSTLGLAMSTKWIMW